MSYEDFFILVASGKIFLDGLTQPADMVEYRCHKRGEIMTNKLVPKKAKTVLFYECPSCEMDLEISAKCASQVGKYVCDFCDHVLELEPITVTIRKDKKEQKLSVELPPKSNNDNLNQQLFEDCVSMLRNLGYKKADAESITRARLSSGINNVDDFIKSVM